MRFRGFVIQTLPPFPAPRDLRYPCLMKRNRSSFIAAGIVIVRALESEKPGSFQFHPEYVAALERHGRAADESLLIPATPFKIAKEY